eukprot:m.76403 g.76403  ORF g.76403 m.76403 type:complete len:652 (+) comp12555_c0_seq2:297-2252(+)
MKEGLLVVCLLSMVRITYSTSCGTAQSMSPSTTPCEQCNGTVALTTSDIDECRCLTSCHSDQSCAAAHYDPGLCTHYSSVSEGKPGSGKSCFMKKTAEIGCPLLSSPEPVTTTSRQSTASCTMDTRMGQKPCAVCPKTDTDITINITKCECVNKCSQRKNCQGVSYANGICTEHSQVIVVSGGALCYVKKANSICPSTPSRNETTPLTTSSVPSPYPSPSPYPLPSPSPPPTSPLDTYCIDNEDTCNCTTLKEPCGSNCTAFCLKSWFTRVNETKDSCSCYRKQNFFVCKHSTATCYKGSPTRPTPATTTPKARPSDYYCTNNKELCKCREKQNECGDLDCKTFCFTSWYTAIEQTKDKCYCFNPQQNSKCGHQTIECAKSKLRSTPFFLSPITVTIENPFKTITTSTPSLKTTGPAGSAKTRDVTAGSTNTRDVTTGSGNKRDDTTPTDRTESSSTWEHMTTSSLFFVGDTTTTKEVGSTTFDTTFDTTLETTRMTTTETGGDSDSDKSSSGNQTAVAVVVSIFLFLLLIAVIAFLILRRKSSGPHKRPANNANMVTNPAYATVPPANAVTSGDVTVIRAQNPMYISSAADVKRAANPMYVGERVVTGPGGYSAPYYSTPLDVASSSDYEMTPPSFAVKDYEIPNKEQYC